MKKFFYTVGVDEDGDVFIRFLGRAKFTFYKPHQGRAPIFSWSK